MTITMPPASAALSCAEPLPEELPRAPARDAPDRLGPSGSVAGVIAVVVVHPTFAWASMRVGPDTGSEV